MSTLFVERSGACVGGESLIDQKALQKLRSALPDTDRARLHWITGYVGSPLLAAEEIRDMGVWLDLFGHAREVGLDMSQIRSFIDSARGERFLQNHQVRSVDPLNGSHKKGNGDATSQGAWRQDESHPRKQKSDTSTPPAAHSMANGRASDLKPGQWIKDLDQRRGKRSGKVIEVAGDYAKIQWESGRVNTIALKRLLVPRLFSIGSR